MDDNRKSISPLHLTIIIFAAIGGSGLLYYFAAFNYLLFHMLAEFYSIAIAFGLFFVAWNTRKYSDSPYMVYLGILYLFIGLIDFLHTIAYKGMPIFTDYDYYANQLWIAARYIESISLLVFMVRFNHSQQHSRHTLVFLIYFLLFVAVLFTVFIFKIFPVCFIEGSGLTPFKKISEYIISLTLTGSGIILYLRRSRFEKRVYQLLMISIVATIFSELAFTFYSDNYGIMNFVGHLFKIVSFYTIYKAIIETALQKPMSLLFQNLQKSNSDKDRFFSIIGHDLRNPFNGIQTSSQLLLEDYDQISQDEQRELIALMNTSAKVASKLLDNLLLWARLQTGRMEAHPKSIGISELIQTNLDLYAASIKKKNLTIQNTVTESAKVYADPEMTDFIIRNLISNAVKFTPPGGRIELYYTRPGGLSVKDTGVGISEERTKQLFKIGMNNSTPGTNEEKGTGLGLLLVKEFVENNNGTLVVESTPGKGSMFTVSFPPPA